MSQTVENLILDLIEWLALKEHTYQETLEAWRTSCPRLSVWEDATDRGLVTSVSVDGRTLACPTAAGLALLRQRRRASYDRLSAPDG